MSTNIFYGDSGILAYPTGQPCPLFGESDSMIRYGGRWSVQKNITLQGVLSGCTYSTILNEKAKLERIYAKDFQPLIIIQEGVELYRSDCNVIRGIEFGQSNYFGLLPYSVNIEAYPRDLTSGVYGVLEPENYWEFNEAENELLEVTHKISARGWNTNSGLSNAIDNAKNYVLSLTGTNSFISPYFTSYCTGLSLCVDTISENIDRFNNRYSITEKYIPLDMHGGGIAGGYVRYVSEYQCDSLGVATLNLNGEVRSCKNTDLAGLRSKYQSFDPFSSALTAYIEASNRSDLNPDYNSFGITEDPYSKKIVFNYSYDNDSNPKTYFDYVTEAKIDENDITTIEVRGVIKSRGDLKVRWAQVQSFYNSLNLFTLAAQAYNDFIGSATYPLNPNQISFSLSKNQFIGEISVSASYNNKTLFSNKFTDLDYTISVVPGINKIRSLPLVSLPGTSCNLPYYSVFLGFASRASVSIQGRANGSCAGNYANTLAEIKNIVNRELLSISSNNNIYLERNNITQSNENVGKNYKFDFGWSMQAANPCNPSPFSQIATLSLK